MQSVQYYSTFSSVARGCLMMDNTNTRCIICMGGYILGTKGVCGFVDPFCTTYNPEDYSCVACMKGYSYNGTFCSG